MSDLQIPLFLINLDDDGARLRTFEVGVQFQQDDAVLAEGRRIPPAFGRTPDDRLPRYFCANPHTTIGYKGSFSRL
jgi:hypothetical protein